MANEQMQQTLEQLKKNLEAVVIVVLLVLVGGVGMLYMKEGNQTPPPTSSVTRATLEEILPSDNTKKADRLFGRSGSLEKNEEYSRLVRFNMFRALSPQDKEALERQADEQYKQATQLFKQKKWQEARDAVLEALNVFPPHEKSQKLLHQIDERIKKAAEAATPTPAAQ